jgi:hypothetical protein
MVTHQTISWEELNQSDSAFLDCYFESWIKALIEGSNSLFENWAGNVGVRVYVKGRMFEYRKLSVNWVPNYATIYIYIFK